MLTRRLRQLPIGAQDIILPHCFFHAPGGKLCGNL